MGIRGVQSRGATSELLIRLLVNNIQHGVNVEPETLLPSGTVGRTHHDDKED